MKTTNEIRSLFLNFFSKHSHHVVPSSSLIPHNDPTLMFTNSGMVQFKDIFLDKEKSLFKKATSSQKCVRAGGKHNDLDNVGYTKRHLTFFEMLGNFSFGDYFKQDAIEYAWNFITKELALDPNRIYITVYHEDDESFRIWKKLTNFPDSKIIRISTNDNFWSMGDVGPCGPCSEIFYDQGEHLWGGLPGSKDQDGDRYVEIWNLVFMEKEQIDKKTIVSLPKKSIDTGMGLERVSSIIQGVHDNFKIDIFQSIIDQIDDITGIKSVDRANFSHRIIADHLRSSAFLISDGVMPLNEGRGYVLRRIMRRAIRHIHNLKYKDLLLHQLLPVLTSEMGACYPELIKNQELISEIFKQEESSFKATIDRGMKLIEVKTQDLKKNSVLPGEVAFELHDTYGFPVDLTEDILKEKNISVDMDGFTKHMNMQKEKARKAWSGSGDKVVQSIWFDIKDSHGLTEFLGYSDVVSQGKITALIQDGKKVEAISNKNEFSLITNQTPFYGESGGQMGDIGKIFDGKNLEIEVLDTKKPLPGLHVHLCKLKKGSVSVGDTVNLEINIEYRNALRRNHTATHLLHSALRSLVGKHIAQRGSSVANDKLRFDFSHNGSIPKEKLNEIEMQINATIISDSEVRTKIMKYDAAVNEGAMALFGEKYEDEVRVVFAGGEEESHSIELCGGTHVSRLGEIGGMKIVSESAISSGIRRIEAITGIAAYQAWCDDSVMLSELSMLMQSKNDELLEKVNILIKKNKELEKKLKGQKQSALVDNFDEKEITVINDISFLSKTLDNVEVADLRGLLQKHLLNKNNNIALLFGITGDKLSFVCGVTKDLHSKVGAKSLIKIVGDHFGSSGGGNDLIAQGGGKMEENKIKESVAAVINSLKSV